MICPKCGTAIKDGYMYCSKCGEEVIMVPDYEVELDAGIEQTISEVAEMMADSVEDLSTDTPADESDAVEITAEPLEYKGPPIKDNIKKTGSRILIASAVILGLLFVFGIYRLLSFVNYYYSYDKQYARLKEEFDGGDYEAAVKTAKHVISLKPKEEQPKLYLADSYYELKKYDESIAVLNDILNDFPQDVTVYERLLEEYEIEGDTDSIIRLSQRSEAADISAMFDAYVPKIPEFGIEGGNYNERLALQLISPEGGTIYYTLDGTEPTTGSEVYSEQIMLEEGETTVTAICVNSKGVVSEPVSQTYIIEISAPEILNLITAPGDYSVPELIKLTEPASGSIYYTVDGTDPNADSKKYEPPLPMPLGKSEFKFAIVNESGVAGETVTAEYNLSIKGVYDAAYAQNAVQLKLISLGHPVMDHEFSARYGYAHDGRSYYMVEEYAVTDGKKQKQGTVYAVDSQSGEVFTITRNTTKGDYDFGIVN